MARNVKRLNEVERMVREKGAEVSSVSIDATDSKKLSDYILEQDNKFEVKTMRNC